jgi:pyruvate-formate lyase-activating enzyme
MLPKFTDVLFCITDACSIGCEHCGFLGSGRDREASPEEIGDWVSQAATYGVPRVIFTGGEPFQRMQSLAAGVNAAVASDTSATAFTSAFWAKHEDNAQRVLDKVAGLSYLYISTDVYHQRVISLVTVRHAIVAALDRGIGVCLCTTYAHERDRVASVEQLSEFEGRVAWHFDHVIPTQFQQANFASQHMPAAPPGSTTLFSSSCYLETPLVDPVGDVLACHIGKASAHASLRHLPYYLGSLREAGFTDIMDAASTRPDYQFLRTHGPRGVAELRDRNPSLSQSLGRTDFVNGCDLCFTTLRSKEGRDLFTAYTATPEAIDETNISLTLRMHEGPIAVPTSNRCTSPKLAEGG